VAESRSKIHALEDQVERRYMIMTDISVDPGNEIIGLYLQENELYALSTKRVFKMLMFAKDKVKT
jgi:hypothetical protein